MTHIRVQKKRYTREQILALAKYEYARQLSIYTRSQLNHYAKKHKAIVVKTATSNDDTTL